MKEVDCVHCMGVSSHSSNTSGCQRTVNALYHGEEEMLVSVMLVIEKVGTANIHISAISTGLLKLYLYLSVICLL